ncbi:eukaryotic translation initiation factor 4 gamma 3 [Pleuronectes platessa]|uniref:eukaryotic translation initiation factor 4 gamma 3 n=1 Tax=Pleuronectes platessa TaxID=8262 RepID=UPI00232A2B76|nr:eukaryotic translation initiation factor 4 gamma 3 [Pleuronectes platessa]
MNRAPMPFPPPQAAKCDIPQMNQNKLPSRVVVSRVISIGHDFTPAFVDLGRQSVVGRGAPLINLGARGPPTRKIITSLSVHDSVPLKKSGNAWKPGMNRVSIPAEPESHITQDLFKKVRSILNKVTPEKFKQLMKQVWDLTIDTEERLKGVVDLVFEKAIDEPSFSVTYGNMCSCLAELTVPTTGHPNNTVNFRELLLSRCQREFEKNKVDDVAFETKLKELDSAASVSTERDRLQVELQEAKDITRRRSIGNIKFIGELYKLKMLNGTIMHDCVAKLLKNHDQESLECLCRLLTTIGRDLDFDEAKPRMDHYFNCMETIAKASQTSSRIRFMLQDTIDLRLQNWVPRRADQGPKTIEQIHKEATIEEQEEQRNVQQQLLTSETKSQPDPEEQEDQLAQGEETWKTYDPSKMPKFCKPQMDENTYLGPPSQVTWVKGCSGGAKAIDSAPEVQQVGEKSSSPGLVQPEAPVERLEAQSTPPTGEPELPLPSSQCRTGRKRRFRRKRSDKQQISSPTTSLPDPITRGNSSEEQLESPTPQSVTQDPAPEPETSRAPEPDEAPEVQPVGERSSSPGLVLPEAPVERLEAESTPPTSEPELHLLSTLSTPINLPLQESRTELETAAHEPTLMPPAALQPQASSPADREASSETVASYMRPQVPTPPQTPDSDARKTLESQCRTGRKRRYRKKRSDKQQISSPTSSLPGPFTRGNSSEELLESPTPQSVTQDPAPEPETSRAPEPDEAPEVQAVGERSSSPGLVLPEAPVERLEAQSTPPTSEPELHLLSTLSTPINLPLRESRTELETAAHEPSLVPPAALQPQASSPADREASSETVASDMRPQVPTPPQTPDSDTRKTLESQCRTGRKRRYRKKRSDKQQISSPTSSLPGPFTRGNSSEELLESPTPQSVTQDPAPEPETSRAPEPVKPEPVVQMTEKPVRSAEMIQRKSLLEEFLHMNNSKSDACSSEATLSDRSWSPGDLTHQMERHLLEDMSREKEIFNCVKEKLDRSQLSSSHYLRELMTAVCKAAAKENTSCRVHTALIHNRLPLYLNYRDSESERQRHALQELQALMVTLDQPPNLLRIFFECLKQQEVISVDVSCRGGTSKDPAEQLGTGVALKTVTDFFTWLREEESEDN